MNMKMLKSLVFLMSAMILVSCQSKKEESTMVEKKSFGKLSNGEEVYFYTLTNKNGLKAEITNYGATVVSLFVPDKNGKLEDVVLGYDDVSGYEKGESYFGGIVGRYGNRIGKGKFSLDGTDYQLSINNGENHLHGGKLGFNKRVWQVVGAENKMGGSFIALKYVSVDGEEGYPGTVELTVNYQLSQENELWINYTATTDKNTILNPTHHSYFNLSGDPSKTILEHELMIDADKYTPVDKGLITTGELADVANTPFDFRKPKAIGKDIDADNLQIKFGLGYDHNWVLNKHPEQVFKFASVYEAVSGRLMEILTDQPGVQFYSGNFLDGKSKGKHGVMYQYRTGFCMEAQKYPDSPNKPEWPSATLKASKKTPYRQTTIYKFSTK